MSAPATVIEARTNRSVWLVALLALALRLMLLYARGDYIVYDEGYYLLLARSLRAGTGFALNGLPHVALSPLQPVLVAGLSIAGIPDLWASRLLAALCGALLVVPAASLAARWFGDRGARNAALLVAVYPALITFVPFFPGQGWNLYFGSEPLYLLLAVSAVAAAIRAVYEERWTWWIVTGLLGGLAWLTRLEGIVLSAALGIVMLAALLRRGRMALWPRALATAAAGLVVAMPYLFYLHGALGRWALSGRVQAAAAAEGAAPAPASATPQRAGGGSQAVNDFVWGGDTEALWRTLYALDASGTRMGSQYWGVAPAAPGAPAISPGPIDSAARAPRDTSAAAPAPPPRSAMGTLVRAVLVVVPLWLVPLVVWGLVRARPVSGAALWLSPLVVAALLPALLAYAEPRALLPLAPLSCILAAGACEHLRSLIDQKVAPRAGMLAPTVVAALLMFPTLRDFGKAWGQQTSLQQLATARRIVGEYLGGHLPDSARIMSWHPAVAIWARRDWRVLPYESFQRIVNYAGTRHASAVVFSRFEPSPLRDPPRAFTAVLMDRITAIGPNVTLETVDQTPSLFVGRLTDAIPARVP